MESPIEFNEFYRLLREVKKGNNKKSEELEWILAEYEHGKDCKSHFDELGQIFCHMGVMKLYEYVGVEDIKYISALEQTVWNYLKKRMGEGAHEHLVECMKSHAEKHELSQVISEKWGISKEELENNIEGLAAYVTDGILEVVI